MTRKKYKINSINIYSEKRCERQCAPGQRRCHECLLRPEGPTRHGNQEGRQVDQGDVDGEYPPWSAIFGSLRYMNLIEKCGDKVDSAIINELQYYQSQARLGLNYIPKTDADIVYREYKDMVKVRRKKTTTAAAAPAPAPAAAAAAISDKPPHQSLTDIIRPPIYHAASRTPYLVQNVVHISPEELAAMLKEKGVDCEDLHATK